MTPWAWASRTFRGSAIFAPANSLRLPGRWMVIWDIEQEITPSRYKKICPLKKKPTTKNSYQKLRKTVLPRARHHTITAPRHKLLESEKGRTQWHLLTYTTQLTLNTKPLTHTVPIYSKRKPTFGPSFHVNTALNLANLLTTTTTTTITTTSIPTQRRWTNPSARGL